jgi:hypothetical protein
VRTTQGRLSSTYRDRPDVAADPRESGRLLERQCLLGAVVHAVAGVILAPRGHLVDQEYAMTEIV